MGSPASCMDLELYGAEEQLLGRLDCDEALLCSYPVANGCRVHVGPSSPSPCPFFPLVLTPKLHPATTLLDPVSLLLTPKSHWCQRTPFFYHPLARPCILAGTSIP